MQYLEKGSKVAVTGRLQTHNYETDTGEKRTGFEVAADSVEFIGRTRKHAKEDAEAAQPAPDDEIPF